MQLPERNMSGEEGSRLHHPHENFKSCIFGTITFFKLARKLNSTIELSLNLKMRHRSDQLYSLEPISKRAEWSTELDWLL
jgi:hypothetical protein